LELKSEGAKIIAVCEEGDVEVAKHSEECIEMPRDVPEVLTPISYVIPLQLLAYYVAVERFRSG
jgi:glucosamine--fructose-6-phosphate aminotransferase (isomerizing)